MVQEQPQNLRRCGDQGGWGGCQELERPQSQDRSFHTGRVGSIRKGCQGRRVRLQGLAGLSRGGCLHHGCFLLLFS